MTRGPQVAEADLAQSSLNGRQRRPPYQDVDLGSGGEGLRGPGVLSNAVRDAGAIESVEGIIDRRHRRARVSAPPVPGRAGWGVGWQDHAPLACALPAVSKCSAPISTRH